MLDSRLKKPAQACVLVATLLSVLFFPLPFGRLGTVNLVPMQNGNASYPIVAVFGDSVASQYLPYLSESLSGCMIVYYLAEPGRQSLARLMLDKSWVPANARGAENLAYIISQQWDQQLDFAIFNVGLHDVKAVGPQHNITFAIDAYRANLRRVFSVLGVTAENVGFVATTPVVEGVAPGSFSNAMISEFNLAAQSESGLQGASFIDTYTPLSAWESDLFASDGYHLSELGSQRMSEHIKGYLLQEIESKGRSLDCE